MSSSLREWLNTSQFAKAFGVKGSTVRRGLCVNGHYMGMRPRKLPNGRLIWDAEPVRQLRGEAPDCPRPMMRAGGAL